MIFSGLRSIRKALPNARPQWMPWVLIAALACGKAYYLFFVGWRVACKTTWVLAATRREIWVHRANVEDLVVGFVCPKAARGPSRRVFILEGADIEETIPIAQHGLKHFRSLGD